ncbi:MAG: hypothetical protein KME10_14970 [Plectolyngbya sp. WJT66-NPBG17]|nr:hypothetical protein [Plectolyngbya sp. WJT66-NPBG17]MBW4526632.1 hypothetical protein [Phormidium tanganyikae FI6-MK23]
MKLIRQLLATLAIGIVLLLNPSFTSSVQSAGLLSATDMLIADLGVKSNASDVIYPGSNVSNTDHPDVGPLQQTSLPPLPNSRQPMIDRADPSSKVFERAGQSIQDASSFLKDTVKAANERPESKMNPAIEK